MTLLRSKLVREESLARFSRELGLGAQIFLGAGEEHNGGRDRNSVLADIFEAFIGAISEDCGIEYVLKILDMTIYKHVEDVNYDDITDFKTKLQELFKRIKERQSHIHYFQQQVQRMHLNLKWQS